MSNIFDMYIHEAYKPKGLINGVNYTQIRKDGKNYRVKLPDDIKKEATEGTKFVISKLSELQKSTEFKNIVKNLKPEGTTSLISRQDKTVHAFNGYWVYAIEITSDISQDTYFREDENGNALYKLVYKLFESIRKDKKLTSLPHFYFISTGDDYYGIDMMFKICKEGEEELVEL
ncbi:MAG: hypothetical protein IKR19_08610 [Acholeplasmatales bacterium]|nr:hypothetical protein [Acholeplasmatales bacterium]